MTTRSKAVALASAGGTSEDAQVARLREPPHSIDAEQSLLGALLSDGAGFARAAEGVSSADFYRHEHRLIFGAIEAVARRGEPIDPVSVLDELEGEPMAFGGLPYLTTLTQSTPSAAHVARYAQIVAEKATLRRLIAEADEVASLAFSPNARPETVLDRARTGLARIENERHVRANKVPLLNLAQLEQSEQTVAWLVKRVIPASSIGMLFGASGAFKSFVALDAALHIAHGLPWLGRRTRQGAVVYVAAEGGAGVWRRIKAWHSARRKRWQDAPVSVVPVALDLRAEAWRVVEAAQSAGVTPAIVVVDTLSQTYSGEENSASEMASYLRELRTRFRELWGCAVLVIHHSGHNATERPRGSSAIKANVDFLLGMFRDEKEMLATLTCAHQKDGETFDDETFVLTAQELGTDDDGDRITSLVARHLTSAEEIEQAQEKERGAGRIGRHQLLLSLVQNGMDEAGLRKAFFDECGIESLEARRQAYHRARQWAVDRGFIEVALDRGRKVVIALTKKRQTDGATA